MVVEDALDVAELGVGGDEEDGLAEADDENRYVGDEPEDSGVAEPGGNGGSGGGGGGRVRWSMGACSNGYFIADWGIV